VWCNRFFFVGNSRINWRIIESIFDSLFTYACSAMSFIVVHVTKIRCFELPDLKFSFVCFENLLLWISLSWIFEKDCDFFTWNPTKHLSKVRRLFVIFTFAQYCMQAMIIRQITDKFCQTFYQCNLYKDKNKIR